MRPAVQSLVFATWRNLGRAESLRTLLVAKRPPLATDGLLCVALALAWSPAQAVYDDFTLVNQSVEATKRSPSMRGQAGLVNACLRRFLRERDALVAQTELDPVARWNYPRWWIERIQHEYAEHWERILHAGNVHAPMTLRVNTRRTNVAEYAQRLQTAGVSVKGVYQNAIVLQSPVPVHSLPDFDLGHVSVQDMAAQLGAPLLVTALRSKSFPKILDACAAPGGKTGHLLELLNADLTALDIDQSRCTRIHENLSRLGLQAKVIAADAANRAAWWDGQRFDAILLDAPCTASGIVRRHPDARWLRREADIAKLASLQKNLLDTLWPLLQPSGHLVYCTCSVFHAEGREQIQTFLANNTDAQLLPSPGHILPGVRCGETTVPDNLTTDHDGFFYALLTKQTR